MLTAGPARSTSWWLFFAALVVLLAGLFADAGGRLLTLPLAAALAGLGLQGLVLSPVLHADVSGVSVQAGLHRRRLSWAEIDHLRVVTDRRTPLLEIDLGDSVIVLSRRRLGRPPSQVLADLQEIQAAAR